MKTKVGDAWIIQWIERQKVNVENLRALRALLNPAVSELAREGFHLVKDFQRDFLNADPPHNADIYAQEVSKIADAYREFIE